MEDPFHKSPRFAPIVGPDKHFVKDSQERQFATDTEAELTVVQGSGGAAGGGATRCATAPATLKELKRSLKKLDRRIHKLCERIEHTHSDTKRAAEKWHLKKLRKRRRKLAHRRHKALLTANRACGAS